ncbi:hypothetical protein ACFLYK_03165, partial [Candidatus Cloacimonadota bacterium]
LIGAALLLYRYWQDYYSDLTDLAESHPEQALTKLVNLVKAIVYINPLITAVFMIYLIVVGAKTYRSEQFPPPGVKVIRDTKLTEGDNAKKYAVGLWFIAAALMVFAIVITILLNNFLRTIY